MRQGFSLVELSIVLVILGLLTGGILAGKSLIRASELRSVTTEYTRYVTAARAFRDKYFYLPGDITNASVIWGPLDGVGGDGKGSDCRGESSTTLTCNGDGDGLFGPSAAGTFETALFWKHLANAGMIEGSYSGSYAQATKTMCYAPGSSAIFIAGCNAPQSKLDGGAWTVLYIGDSATFGYTTSLAQGNYGNTLVLASNNYSVIGFPTAGGSYLGMLKTEELWNIDTKMDDGLPGTGRITGASWAHCVTGAASSSDLANGIYNLASSVARCSIIFRNVF